ncbi:MAG: hypothetical protein K0R75_3034 [Paenibacillaceae bacterium]|nr:hypothetical protein [Paenibacillaceae bacterium]
MFVFLCLCLFPFENILTQPRLGGKQYFRNYFVYTLWMLWKLLPKGDGDMQLKFAREAAADWVERFASREAWFVGAYFSGSTVGMPDEAELPVASDVDLVVVIDVREPPMKPGKLIYLGVLLEVTYLTWDLLKNAEEVLGNHHLAGSFRVETIVADPTGQLRQLQEKVARHFADGEWVRRRCQSVLDKIEGGLRSLDPNAPWHDLVTSLLFSTGITTHLILVAALRNPTVRLRYLKASGVLEEYGHFNFYGELLRLLGCENLSTQRAMHHLDELARTFDTAAAIAKTPFFFSSDISEAARPIAIDGSRELISAGNQREAYFWMIATFARCHKILAADAPVDLKRELEPAFRAAVAELGITSQDDITRRAGEVIAFLPRLASVAVAIIDANPEIR